MHLNDTLQGELVKWERPEDAHLRYKLGYWHMVEERKIRAELIEAGHDPAEIGFTFLITKKRVENHANDETHREASERRWGVALARQQAEAQVELARDEATQDAIEALRRIRDGHNDPRALAMEVLARLEGLS